MSRGECNTVSFLEEIQIAQVKKFALKHYIYSTEEAYEGANVFV